MIALIVSSEMDERSRRCLTVLFTIADEARRIRLGVVRATATYLQAQAFHRADGGGCAYRSRLTCRFFSQPLGSQSEMSETSERVSQDMFYH